MKNHDQISKLTGDALNSFDGATRATPKPYLFTRLNARMQHAKESSWDNTFSFISKPAFAFVSLCLVIGINATVIYNYPAKTSAAAEELYATTDEYTSSVAVLNDIENIEP